jgi:hypothetical protein
VAGVKVLTLACSGPFDGPGDSPAAVLFCSEDTELLKLRAEEGLERAHARDRRQIMDGVKWFEYGPGCIEGRGRVGAMQYQYDITEVKVLT